MDIAIILRTLIQAGFTTKGDDLTWEELDTNIINLANAIKTLSEIDSVLTLQGGYDPTITSLYPVAANTIGAAPIQKGDTWYITTAGNVHGIAVGPGSVVFAKVDAAANNVDADWVVIDSSLNFTDLFKTWAMSLPGYDKDKKQALTTVGSGADTFEWSPFITP